MKLHNKKYTDVKSYHFGGELTTALRDITIPSKMVLAECAPHVFYVHIIQLWQKIGNYSSISVAVDGNGITNVVFENVWTNDVAGPETPPNSSLL